MDLHPYDVCSVLLPTGLRICIIMIQSTDAFLMLRNNKSVLSCFMHKLGSPHLNAGLVAAFATSALYENALAFLCNYNDFLFLFLAKTQRQIN